MFLATFARLASEYSSLRAIFELVDRTVADTSSSLLDAHDLASELNDQEGRVESALAAAAKAGVLTRLEGRCCDHCGQWHRDVASVFECTQCETANRSKRTAVRYRLSEAGRAELRVASAGLGTSRWPQDISAYRGKVRIAIVTIKPEEEDAVLGKFPSQHSVKGQREYHLTRTNTLHGETILVASVRLPRQGNLESQLVVGQLIDDLAPTCVLLVGIGGASPFADAVLEDVVFGSHVHDLTVALDNADGSKQFAGEGGPMIESIVAAATHLRPKLQALELVGDSPSVDLDSLEFTTEDTVLNQKIHERLRDRVVDGKLVPRVLVGPILSSDTLMKNPAIARQWCDTRRDALAIDMEFAGAYRAARSGNRTSLLLAIRAMSDIVGLKKGEGWVRHACLVAAEYAHAFALNWKP